MKKYKTNCIVCWKKIDVSFEPSVESVQCVDVICCKKDRQRHKQVLVVDDENSILNLVERALTKQGIDVTTSTTSHQALGKIKTGEHFDLVISDYELRETLGLSLLSKILLIRPKTKTILMSGYSLTSNEVSVMPINGYLQKPFELKVLKSVVQKVLNKKGGKQ
ncbi:MAG: response regulator [Elusimicrobiota bacterium]